MATMEIEVAYALPDRQAIIAVSVETGTTIEAAILQSGILDQFPDIDLAKQKVGIFNEKRSLSEVVHAGDRIEIYRPLTIDPKEARRAKARAKVKALARIRSQPKAKKRKQGEY